jgi:hypothetical protein
MMREYPNTEGLSIEALIEWYVPESEWSEWIKTLKYIRNLIEK